VRLEARSEVRERTRKLWLRDGHDGPTHTKSRDSDKRRLLHSQNIVDHKPELKKGGEGAVGCLGVLMCSDG